MAFGNTVEAQFGAHHNGVLFTSLHRGGWQDIVTDVTVSDNSGNVITNPWSVTRETVHRFRVGGLGTGCYLRLKWDAATKLGDPELGTFAYDTGSGILNRARGAHGQPPVIQVFGLTYNDNAERLRTSWDRIDTAGEHAFRCPSYHELQQGDAAFTTDGTWKYSRPFTIDAMGCTYILVLVQQAFGLAEDDLPTGPAVAKQFVWDEDTGSPTYGDLLETVDLGTVNCNATIQAAIW